MKHQHSILFSLEDDALVVANTGRPFDRKGVISICKMDLSSKGTDESRGPEDDYKKGDCALVDAILQTHLNTYKADFSRLIEDVNHESGVETGYDGRLVLELLQNADDAAGAMHTNAELIGAKGLGFKAVLEITNEPEIYSGEFNFHFSRVKSQVKLQEELGGKWKESHGIPVCRLPHSKNRDELAIVQALFDEDYVTVIRLPFSAENKDIVKDTVKKELDEFCISSLLFCQSIDEVKIHGVEQPRHIKVFRKQPTAGAKVEAHVVELTDNGNRECWQVWRKQKDVAGEKRISTSVSLRITDGEFQFCEDVPPLHVFFPTIERLQGVHAFVHVSCDVESNRQHLAQRQHHAEDVCDMLKNITEAILLEIPTSVALHAFGRISVSTAGTMVAKLEASIAEAVRETAFIPIIGGDIVKPADTCLWKHGLGSVVDPDKVHDKNLCTPEIQSDKDAVAILDGLGAKDVDILEHANILKNCKNATKRECVAVWAVAQSLMQKVNDNDKDECGDTLRKTPFWLTSAGHVRAIDGNIPLIVQKPEDFPDWLSVDVVENGFLQLLGDKKSQLQKDENWHDALSSAVAPVLSKQYFAHILLPYCKEQSHEGWKTNGWKILEMTRKWGDSDDVKPLIIDSDDTKEQRAKIMRLPVGKGTDNWAPAWQCYAGAKWGGPKAFDRYFEKIENRFLLSPLRTWFPVNEGEDVATDIEHWKGLLSWLGCSWEPKMVYQQAPHPSRSADDPNPVIDFYFEHFEEMLAIFSDGKQIDDMALLSMASEMYKTSKNNSVQCRRSNRLSTCESYACIQLEKTKWVPCKSSILGAGRYVRPKDAYLPKCGLGGLLPEVDKGAFEGDQWESIRVTLLELGAAKRLPDDATRLVDYMNVLSEYANRGNADLRWRKKNAGGDIARAAKAVFHAYPEASPLDDDVMVPCLRHTRQGEELYFEKVKNVYWADKSYFDEPKVRRTVLETQELRVFFRFLHDGEKFGLKALSTFLEMKHGLGADVPKVAKYLRARYKERRPGLAKVAGKGLPIALDIYAHDTITLKATKQPKINPEIKFWLQGNAVHINAQGGHIPWRNLAAALADVGECKQYKPDFELLLLERDWNDFRNRLRDDYGLTEESLEEMKEGAPGDVTTSAPSSQNAVHTSSPEYYHPTEEARSDGNDESTQLPASSLAEVPKITVTENPIWPQSMLVGHDSTGGAHVGGHYGYSEQGKETGNLGERVLRNFLRTEYGTANVKDMNEETPNHPGYDMLVTKNGKKFYYECKSYRRASPPPQVELTSTEFYKAKDAGEQYVLCVIYDLNASSAKMLPPIYDPANTLKHSTYYTDLRYRLDLTSENHNND